MMRSERLPAGVASVAADQGGGSPASPRTVAGGKRSPNAEVVPKGKRRRFTAEYKLRILEEADGCREPGEVGALLRREGLYSSHLASWRKQRAAGGLAGLTPKKRGRKTRERNPLEKEVQKLERERERLERELEKARIVIDVQKKVARLLGIPLSTPDDEEQS